MEAFRRAIAEVSATEKATMHGIAVPLRKKGHKESLCHGLLGGSPALAVAIDNKMREWEWAKMGYKVNARVIMVLF